jgi:calcineurin-like phosphoesterase family protein
MRIELKQNQNLFFTSDTHYGHGNICSATTKWPDGSIRTRQFDSLDAMNDTIVNNINAVVGEDDILIHLGDWSFGGFDNITKFRNRIVCKTIHLVLGNHDHHIENNKESVQDLFASVQHYMKLTILRPLTKSVLQKFSFVCMHYPIASWHDMNQGVMHLHGHVHLPPELRIAEGKAMDVGVDGNHLQPMSLDGIRTCLQFQPIKKLELPKDHHETRI